MLTIRSTHQSRAMAILLILAMILYYSMAFAPTSLAVGNQLNVHAYASDLDIVVTVEYEGDLYVSHPVESGSSGNYGGNFYSTDDPPVLADFSGEIDLEDVVSVTVGGVPVTFDELGTSGGGTGALNLVIYAPAPEPEYDISISKVVDDTTATVGQTVYFTVYVDNEADALTGLLLVDDMFDWSTSIDLAEDGSQSFGPWPYTITEDDEDAGSVTNMVYAYHSETGRDEATATVTVYAYEEPPVLVASIDLDKVVSDSSIYRGSSVYYTLTITNDGDYDLFDVLLVDELLGLEEDLGELAVDADPIVITTELFSPTSTVTNTAYVRANASMNQSSVYDEDDATVTVRTRTRPRPDPEPEEEDVPEEEPPLTVPDPEPVPEVVEEVEVPLALPDMGATTPLFGGMAYILFSSLLILKKKF